MSGGSHGYAYSKIQVLADKIRADLDDGEYIADKTDEQVMARRRFVGLLDKVWEAAREIEWVDSCDSRPGDELEPIAACFVEGPVE